MKIYFNKLKFFDTGELVAPGTLTFCYDPSISTPLIIFPKLRKRDDNGELGQFFNS